MSEPRSCWAKQGGALGCLLRFLIAGFLIPFSLGQAIVSIPEVNGLPGTAVNIPVMVRGGSDFTALQMTLEYDPAILSVESDDWIIGGSVFSDHGLDVVRESGKVRVMVFSPSLSLLTADSGLLLQVVIQINFSAGFGSRSDLAITDLFACDAEGGTVGVSADSGTLVVGPLTNSPAPGQNELIFPHLANGAFSGGNFQATMIFVNQSDAPADARLQFASSGDQPFSISFSDGTTDSTVDFSIPPRGSKLFRSDGTGPLGIGYARLSSTTPIAGAILFQINQGGYPLTEVGVGEAPPVRNFQIPVLYKAGVYDTGIALLNSHNETVTVVMTAKEDDGDILATQTIQMTPYEHLAQFSREFFAAIAARDEFDGAIAVSAEATISAIALKQTGLLLTSFPVAVAK